MSQQIKLSNSLQTALVDDEDFYHLSQFDWWSVEDGLTTYAVTEINGVGIRMHQLLMQSRGTNLTPDHIDGNGLNNKRFNLRLANAQQQGRNKQKTLSNTSSQYKGVTYRKKGRKHWEASIQLKPKETTYLGTYFTEIGAAKAYNEAALKHFGEFACVNEL